MSNDKRIFNVSYGRQDHNSEKKHWQNCGVLIMGVNEQGQERLSLKMNCIPLDAEFDGWFSLFPKDDERKSEAENIPFED